MFQYLRRRAVKPAYLFGELGFRQVIPRGGPVRNWRSLATGNKQALRVQTKSTPQRACKFEANQAAHAMTKKRKRFVEIRLQPRSQRLNQRFKSGEWRLAQTHPAPRELYRADLDILRERLRPVTEDQRTTARIWKAEEPHRRRGIWLWQ